ncbi:ATP-binding cassette domain-containing protein [Streptomyces sp. NPDC002055]|uniref:ABC transporter ATP-binding protein n=1 Tax=Streptomyces sp. NPDC002055 TaxID=3154534 RepID=UPI003321D954
MTASTTPVIELRGAGKSYPGGVHALRGVDLRVDRGELVAIVGPSGSGKSTLLNLIGTLDRVSEGEVRVAGYDVGALSDTRLSALRARHIGFVFQHFHLAPGRDAVDNVADGLLYAGVPVKERRARARSALERVRLGHRLDHRPNELSGGEKQRVAIARALVGDPDLLLADEPTGALDSASGEVVMELLHELNAAGTTICVITHDNEIADSLHRRVRFRDGEIVSDSRTASGAAAAADTDSGRGTGPDSGTGSDSGLDSDSGTGSASRTGPEHGTDPGPRTDPGANPRTGPTPEVPAS